MTRILSVLSIVAVGVLSACAVLGGDIANKTYSATDRVMAQAKDVNTVTPVLVGTITDVDQLETSTTFGRMVAEQISTRLTQKGYDVTELKMRNSLNIKNGRGNAAESGEYLLSRNVNVLKSEQKAAVAVTGTYAIAGQNVLVNLKLLDVATGKILGATDYTLPKDANVMRLLGNSQVGSASGSSFYGTSMAY